MDHGRLTKSDLLTFLEQELGLDISTIQAETPLFSSGIIDSFALVSLLGFIEDKCQFRVNPIDVSLENVDSIGRIIAYAHSRVDGARQL